MRMVVLVALLLSGCASQGKTGEPQGEPDDGADEAGTDALLNQTDQGELDVLGNETAVGNGTADQNATLNETAPPPRERGVVAHQAASGSLPADGLEASMPFAVPEGADELVFVYTSTHVGLFTAYVEVTDPAGNAVLDSLATCGAGSSGSATDTCTMGSVGPLAPGTWTATITWQAGQATEDFTLDATVYGLL